MAARMSALVSAPRYIGADIGADTGADRGAGIGTALGTGVSAGVGAGAKTTSKRLMVLWSSRAAAVRAFDVFDAGASKA